MTETNSTDQPTATARVTITVTAPARDAAHHARTIADLIQAEHGDTTRLDIRIDGQAATEATEAGYCPHCGRGDCAPTADQYAQLQDQLAAATREADRWRAGHERAEARLHHGRLHVEELEAVLARVRQAATLHRQGQISLHELHAAISPSSGRPEESTS